jgi:hypothetical protein
LLHCPRAPLDADGRARATEHTCPNCARLMLINTIGETVRRLRVPRIF